MKHTVGPGASVFRAKGQVHYNDMDKVNHTAILLIRNPFKAIICRYIQNVYKDIQYFQFD